MRRGRRMKEEEFELKDKNFLFDSVRAMHDEIMTNIDIADNEIRIEYGRIGENPFFSPFAKMTVSYVLNPLETDYSLNLKTITKRGTKREEWSVNDPEKLRELNGWDMVMYCFSIDLWGEMTLHFNVSNKRKNRLAELSFTPVRIRYTWKEKEE